MQFAVITATALVAVIACAPSSNVVRAPSSPSESVNIPGTDISIDTSQMLAAQNQIRRKLSIPDLKWSNQMAAYATEWALYLSDEAGCNLRNRGLVGLPVHKNGIGENLFKSGAVISADGNRQLNKVAEQQVVLEWARESVDYNYISNECALNRNCDRYTQLVWRDSSVVGCGAASCPNKDQIWVCNYDPPGNFFKQRPY